MDLELQLRAAEARRNDLQRLHAESLAALRDCGTDLLDARQSRVRELEKKVALETVRCEELQLELSQVHRSTANKMPSSSSMALPSSGHSPWISGTGTGGIMTSHGTYHGTTASGGGIYGSHHHGGGGASGGSGCGGGSGRGTEIDRIMAKIEQDNRILAELDHSRSTTLGGGSGGNFAGTSGLATSASSHALGATASGIDLALSPPISPIIMSHTTPSIYAVTSLGGGGIGNHASGVTPLSFLPSHSTGGVSIGGTGGSAFVSAYNAGGYTPKCGGLGLSSVGGGLSGGLGGTLIGGTSGLVSGSGLTGTCLGLGGTGSSLPTGMPTSYTPSAAGASLVPGLNSYGNPTTFTNPITSTLNQYNHLGAAYGSSGGAGPSACALASYNPSGAFGNPLSGTGLGGVGGTLSGTAGLKLKPLEEMDLGVRRVATPCTPHQQPWALTGPSGLAGGIMNVTPSALARIQDGLDVAEWSALTGTGLDGRLVGGLLGGGGGGVGGFQNGHAGSVGSEGTVDMLDIPGRGRCSVYVSRFAYEPEPESEDELAVPAGEYLLVWGEPIGGAAGYLDAELLDGRRGLIPAHFAGRIIGDDLLEFHQAILATLREDEINAETFAADVQRLTEMAEFPEGHEDEADNVPAPRQLTLERQLNKSVLISWTAPPDMGPGNQIESYHVYVDGVLKTTIKATERTRALVEGVDSNRPHRMSVRSVTANRRTSRDAACTMIIGRDTHQLGPSAVRATNITSTQAVISWLPSNSNHQHVVCVNNVEVRTVKPGVYRHTITGLAANTQYRVTVRAKHHRVAQNVANLAEDLPMPAAAHTDFRTLPKGLPDPPSDIQVEAGPQDGTLLVTWHPVLTPHHPGSTITGYSVFTDGKKVTDVDSPTGDHALIDISKLLGLNPKHVTVRTKARDCQSTDSLPAQIPLAVLRGGARAAARQQPHSSVPMHMRQQQQMAAQQMGGMQNRQPGQQQIIEHDENLSDKEIFPNQQHMRQGGIPSIGGNHSQQQQQQPQTSSSKDDLSDEEPTIPQPQHPQQLTSAELRRNARIYQRQQQRQQQQQQLTTPLGGAQQQQQPLQSPGQQQQHLQLQQQQVGGGGSAVQTPVQGGPQGPGQGRQQQMMMGGQPGPSSGMQHSPSQQGGQQQGQQDLGGVYYQQQQSGVGGGQQVLPPSQQGQQGQRLGMHGSRRGGHMGPGGGGPGQPQRRARWFVALFDYDPSTMSPNPDACEEELPFSEGDSIKVWGEKDADGFYWGECRGKRGYVPHNMVMEVEGGAGGPGGASNQSRWGEMYQHPLKRMVALYDYDPQELSPNVDAEQVELTFHTGQIINVYGDMDDDGFYMGEIDGVRGLVPSNFLAEAPDQYGPGGNPNAPGSLGMVRPPGGIGPHQQQRLGMRGHGPGARGPPPPPRDGTGRGRGRDACNVLPSSQLDTINNTITSASTPNTHGFTTEHQGRGRGLMQGQGPVGPVQQRGGNPMMMGYNQQQQNMPVTTAASSVTNTASNAASSLMSSLFGGSSNTQQQQLQQQQQQQQHQQQQQPNMYGNQQQQPQGSMNMMGQQQQQGQQQRMGQQQRGVPQVIPTVMSGGSGMNMNHMQQQPQQQGMGGMPGMPGGGPNLMQKINEITAPGGDILSKGKELIFMKFGLGGK